MSSLKASLKVGTASIELEGPPDVVTAELEKFQQRVMRAPEVAIGTGDPVEPDRGGGGTARRARAGKRSGPSCADRIRPLIEEGTFASPRTLKEVQDTLQERGFLYASNHIAAALIQLVKSNALRRVKQDGAWKYMVI